MGAGCWRAMQIFSSRSRSDVEVTPLSFQFALNGAIALFLGLLGGIFFARAIRTGQGEVAWRVVHAGACMAGAMLLAIAVPVQWIDLPASLRVALGVGFIGGAYLLCAGMFIAAIWSTRGIPGGGSALNRLVSGLYATGTAFSFAGSGLLIAGLLASQWAHAGNASAASGGLVQPLADQSRARGCGWYASAAEVGHGTMFFAELDESAAYMNIRGTDVRIMPDPGRSAGSRFRVGDTLTRTYLGDGVQVEARFRITDVCPPDTESCEVTKYDARFEVTSSGSRQVVAATGERGC